MITVTASSNCGNAPKQTYVRDLLVAAANADRVGVESAVTQGWVHRVAGDSSNTRADATAGLIAALSPKGLTAVHFTHVISHGKWVAASGQLSGAGIDTEFCCMVTFASHSKAARVAECVTYLAPRR